ncbi:MAG: serine/threonine-protein kinase [Planctomycetaceae bacterium]
MPSHPDTTPPVPAEGSGAPARKSFWHFCPFAAVGIVDDWSHEFYCEMRTLLQRRLRYAALILFSGSLIFLLRNFIGGSKLAVDGDMPVDIQHILLTIALGTVAANLWTRTVLSHGWLRFCETVIFGAPALYFLWSQDQRVGSIDVLDRDLANLFIAEATAFWLLLMQIYSISVPNTIRRATLVILLLGALPLISLAAMIPRHPVAAEIFSNGGFTTMFIQLGLGAVVSIWGSYRFGTLRREAFHARQIGSYVLKRRLGGGGMGEVFLAEHRLLKRPCAVKLIRGEIAGDKDVIARFESEVQAAARLTHPNTIEIYDYGHTPDGTFYYVMEYLPGLSLQEMIERFGPIGSHRLVHLLRQVCFALREAHSIGFIHRDIKPGNIFASERGGVYDIAKLLDFGLVKSIDTANDSPNLTMHGTVVGSPQYAAPEAAIEGNPDERSDIYSLGATAYYLLTGQPVFPGENTLKVLFAHVNETPKPPREINPGIPADLEAVVMKCLEKDPAKRYANVIELERALAATSCRDCWTQEMAAKWWTEVNSEVAATDEDATIGDETSVTTVMPLESINA